MLFYIAAEINAAGADKADRHERKYEHEETRCAPGLRVNLRVGRPRPRPAKREQRCTERCQSETGRQRRRYELPAIEQRRAK